MAKFLAVMITILALVQVAKAGEYNERAMCNNTNVAGSFSHISIQKDPENNKRGVLIMRADDGWTQVYSGPLTETVRGVRFTEDHGVISATFDKPTYAATTSFGADLYACDQRSFGN